MLLNASRSRHLVWVGRDETKQPATFHRLLGGHVEFGEPAADAVVREIVEELHAELAQVTLLGVIENVFTYACAPGHEVVFVYAATVADGVVPEEGGSVRRRRAHPGRVALGRRAHRHPALSGRDPGAHRRLDLGPGRRRLTARSRTSADEGELTTNDGLTGVLGLAGALLGDVHVAYCSRSIDRSTVHTP